MPGIQSMYKPSEAYTPNMQEMSIDKQDTNNLPNFGGN